MRFAPRHHVACLAGLLLLAAAREASACDLDNDCKGGRVCIKGACVAPPASMPAGPAPLVGVRCAREKDCPGDETCVNGVCAPQPAAQPAPAPAAPAPAPAASRSCERDGDCSLADVCENRRCIPFAQRSAAPPPQASPPAALPKAPAQSLLKEPPRPAEAAPAAGAREPFGRRGQVVPLGVVSYQSISYDYPTAAPTGTVRYTSESRLSIAPGLEFFLIDHVSVGARVGYSSYSYTYNTGAKGDSSTLFFAPLLGANIPLGDHASLKLNLAFAYYSGTSSSTSSAGTQSAERKDTWLSARAESFLLIHPASHVFIGLGPYYEREFSSKYTISDKEYEDYSRSFLGLTTVIGGWF